jgi:hypothetical protein
MCEDPNGLPLATDPNTRRSSYERDGRGLTGEYPGWKLSAAIGYREGGIGIAAMVESGCRDGSKKGKESCRVVAGDNLVCTGLERL